MMTPRVDGPQGHQSQGGKNNEPITEQPCEGGRYEEYRDIEK
jgi:hypothetical protein